MINMATGEDHEQLARAAELLEGVIERHRSEDLRVISILTAAIQGIQVTERYLGAAATADR
jgi:hypothetical protein